MNTNAVMALNGPHERIPIRHNDANCPATATYYENIRTALRMRHGYLRSDEEIAERMHTTIEKVQAWCGTRYGYWWRTIVYSSNPGGARHSIVVADLIAEEVPVCLIARLLDIKPALIIAALSE